MAVAEYRAGVALGSEPARRAAEDAFLEELLAVTPTIDYTIPVACTHAELLAHARQAGQPRGAYDLIIAACAAATGRVPLTTGTRTRFGELPRGTGPNPAVLISEPVPELGYRPCVDRVSG